MDVAPGSIGHPRITVADLAGKPDFKVGAALVSPSARTVSGPGGAVDLEPRMMQVLVVLADAGGRVVTREALFSSCWGGVYVGDDSLNRAIAGVRRAAQTVAPGSFEIETVPRTGYRLIVPSAQRAASCEPAAGPRTVSPTRRAVIGGTVAAAAVVGGGLWWTLVERPNSRFEELMRRTEQALRDPMADDREIIRMMEEAVALNPGSARAWGTLAMIKGAQADLAPADESARMVEEAKRAAAAAMAIDAREPNALLAMAAIEGTLRGWAGFDARLRQVLAIDPRHLWALSLIGVLTQGAGLNRESWDWNEQALAADPLSPHFLSRRALKLWILGRVAEADRVLDRLRELWPLDDWAFYVRFQIHALTGRPESARAMLEGNEGRLGPPPALAMWRAALEALARPRASAAASARQAILNAARIAPGLAAQGVMILASLREVDAAFDVAHGLLLSRGPIVVRDRKGPRSDLHDPGWRWTPWLFTPPAAVMRTDPRFMPLCSDIGLMDYWRARGVRPDYLAEK